MTKHRAGSREKAQKEAQKQAGTGNPHVRTGAASRTIHGPVLIWPDFLGALLVVLLMVAGLTWLVWPEPDPAPPRSGTVLGLRFSGDFPHRCRLWIRPEGAPREVRVLVDPNSEIECLDARTFDHWERVR